MPKQKKLSFQARAEQLTKEEAWRIAKGTQSPGQTKEQIKLIAKGIEKGIALYKKQEREKSRERAKLRKKRDKQRAGGNTDAPAGMLSAGDADSAAKRPAAKPLAVAGAIFFLVAIAHLARYLSKTELLIGSFPVPVIWSLPAAVVSGLLAVWMFRSMRGSNDRE